MEENENLYDKIKDLLGSFPDNLNILQETIDIDTQIEYFENSFMIKPGIQKEEVMKQAESLFNPVNTLEETKSILSKLALVDKVEAYRIIERYMQNPTPSVREWGILALQESRMLIESKLLDENQVFISTGLGGKGSKLRYFVVLLARNDQSFNATQKRIIRSEFKHCLKKYNGEIEELCFSEFIVTLMTIIPINVTIKLVFKEAIAECNLFGNFLAENFLITNVKALELEEIRDFLKKSRIEKQN